MTLSIPDNEQLIVRPLQYRDVDAINALVSECVAKETSKRLITIDRELEQVGSWYGLKRFLALLPRSYYHGWRVYVAQHLSEVLGLIQVSSLNSTRSTWRVERVLLNSNSPELELLKTQKEIGSQLLRHCLQNIWEARTWMLEVNINEKNHLALYRENGFQPLAQMTYWQISADLIAQLAQQDSDLPNFLPISNADAPLLYQLDCVSMPPLLRQVFDRHADDFKSGMVQNAVGQIRLWLNGTDVVSGYVFEPQRKAAIGYFRLESSKDGSRPHRAQLTVNPAYTWLYPQLTAKMAQIIQESVDRKQGLAADNQLYSQPLEIVSADYQPEREEYFNKIGAMAVEQTLLMSRSVWHKIKEAKPLEGLQLSGVLQGLKPVRAPIPSRISWLKSFSGSYQNIVRKKNIFCAKSSYKLLPHTAMEQSAKKNNSGKSFKPPHGGLV
ncbi:GNAT family N-acetyltransferase [Pleurocapsa sp. CCALA 161]|uniref:GNAT family N-acetyltransferase n=1 Tax=Pleurocapsa sp. CCALA 161 TaxID=2107688 RepID=UPI000D0492D9|nr:GNAT family N-acetyltransferase [Pleurocapsa sp. CCALA 161]PSB07380.1 GNAT family N-acetyltransferase [Pleurocapsa sp. CCALA 161]